MCKIIDSVSFIFWPFWYFYNRILWVCIKAAKQNSTNWINCKLSVLFVISLKVGKMLIDRWTTRKCWQAELFFQWKLTTNYLVSRRYLKACIIKPPPQPCQLLVSTVATSKFTLIFQNQTWGLTIAEMYFCALTKLQWEIIFSF